ncbi:MAG: endonuclease/exonuclease/phosphatase family protein [Bacteroidales bacterium]
MKVCFFLWILLIQSITLSRLAAQPLRILWYNTENLFHPSDDTLAGDDEFTSAGIRRWNEYRYRQKLTALAKVIVAAGGWDPPEVVGMCEVEERRVLEDLTAHPILARYGYQVIHRDGPDHRGTEVACLYREKRVGVAEWKMVPSVLASRGERTRDLLCLELAWGKDTLDIVMVHLISKYGGEGITAMPRREQVVQLVEVTDSLYRGHPDRWKVVAGDFNDPPDAWSMEPVRRSGDSSIRLIQVPLSGARGSYKYQGKWEKIDQFLVCEGEINFEVHGRIVALPALLIRDASDGGVKPFRTYQGPIYQAGISDHLPILLEISRLSFPWDFGR